MPTTVNGELKPVHADPEHRPATYCDPDYCNPDCVTCPESVGWDLSFGSRINFGPATAADGAPLTVHLSLSDDAVARGTVLREITRVQLLTFARHLLTLAKGPGDIEESVAKLGETIARLDEHIAAKAEEIAAVRVADDKRRLTDAAKRAQGDLNLAQGHHQAVVDEFRRQVDALDRQCGKYRQMLTDAGIDWHTGLPIPGSG